MSNILDSVIEEFGVLFLGHTGRPMSLHRSLICPLKGRILPVILLKYLNQFIMSSLSGEHRLLAQTAELCDKEIHHSPSQHCYIAPQNHQSVYLIVRPRKHSVSVSPFI
jgi:hypothetical protein